MFFNYDSGNHHASHGNVFLSFFTWITSIIISGVIYMVELFASPHWENVDKEVILPILHVFSLVSICVGLPAGAYNLWKKIIKPFLDSIKKK